MANKDHRAKTGPSPAFINKVLLETLNPLFTPVYGWFLDPYMAVTTETTRFFTGTSQKKGWEKTERAVSEPGLRK